MKKLKFEIPENTYTLSDDEINVIHALCFYAPDGMTKKGNKIRENLEKQFRMHPSKSKFNVWL